MSRDGMEALANATLGLGVSTVAVWGLRAAEVWQTAPAWLLAALFFVLSLGRARAIRWAFRRGEQ